MTRGRRLQTSWLLRLRTKVTTRMPARMPMAAGKCSTFSWVRGMHPPRMTFYKASKAVRHGLSHRHGKATCWLKMLEFELSSSSCLTWCTTDVLFTTASTHSHSILGSWRHAMEAMVIYEFRGSPFFQQELPRMGRELQKKNCRSGQFDWQVSSSGCFQIKTGRAPDIYAPFAEEAQVSTRPQHVIARKDAWLHVPQWGHTTTQNANTNMNTAFVANETTFVFFGRLPFRPWEASKCSPETPRSLTHHHRSKMGQR